MKKICAIIFALFCVFYGGAKTATASPECTKYTECDSIVACELTLQVEKAIAGGKPDYNDVVARTLNQTTKCKTYPDKFKRNINLRVSSKPDVTLSINWDTVRNRMKYGPQADFTAEDIALLETLVDILGPDTIAQQKFFTALATAYINASKQNEGTLLNDAFVLDFLGSDDNFELYRDAVRDTTGTITDEDYGIDIDWDNVLTEISNVLDTTVKKRGMIVCENNRSIQLGIDTAGWVATIAAAIATFYAGGAGGAGVAAGRAAIGAGLKAAATSASKVGAKAASKKIIKAGIRTVGKDALKRGALKTGAKNFIKIVGQNLTKKWVAITATGAAVWGLGNAVSNTGSTIYSLVSSELDKTFLNCQDLDHNEGCYTVCGDGQANDYLNQYALEPVLGKTYCVNPDDYAMYEINPDGSRGKLMTFDHEKMAQIKSLVTEKVQDQGTGSIVGRGQGCDWNEDDIDLYIGAYVYDPDTLEISDEAMVIDDAMRLDQ